jgi:predicted phosphodiesterase
MIHNIAEFDIDPATAGIDIVLFGHSHQPTQYKKDGVLYVNPGSAGPRRFSLPISLARLDLAKTPWSLKLVTLDQPG